MKTKQRIGSALIGAAMALTGCAGGVTTSDPAALEDVSTVESTIDGRTDLFLDRMLSNHLLTADEVNGSPTAIAVQVEVRGDQLLAWRLGSSHTDADIVGQFHIRGTVDLSTAQAIGNETHPGDPGTIILPGGVLGGLRGARTEGSGSIPRLRTTPPPVGLVIEWGVINGIPNAVDVNTLNAAAAHPGCA